MPTRAPVEKPRSQEAPNERLRRAHDALDTFRRLGGFLFIPCACGVNLKVPPGFSRPEVKCPRCGAAHNLSEARQGG
jgi:heat shock protein HtpX